MSFFGGLFGLLGIKGLFDKKTITSVSTVVNRVIEDKGIPSSLKTGTLGAIINEGDISDHVMEQLVASIAVRADRMYDYAKKSYTNGLPSGQYQSATQGTVKAQAVLEALEGGPVQFEYCRVGSPNVLHIAWMALISSHGYNPSTNTLSGRPNTGAATVYLHDLQVILPPSLMSDIGSASLEQWGTAARAGYTPFRVAGGLLNSVLPPGTLLNDGAAEVAVVRATYVWQGSGGVAMSSYFDLPVPDDLNAADYFHIKYRVGGVIKYWMYEIGAGTHQTLDAAFSQPGETQGAFFPFVHFRHNRASTTSDKNTAEFKSTKKMLKYINVDFEQVADGINANPDIAEVEQAMMIMAVPANTSNPLEQRYLYDFFDALFAADVNQFQTRLAANIAAVFDVNGESLVRTTMTIQDAKFKMALSNGGIFKRRVGGSIGAKGTYSSGYGSQTFQRPYKDELSGETLYQPVSFDTHTYRRQVSHAFYDEINLVDLRMVYYVFGHFTTIGDDTDSILLIPLDMSITKNYQMADREVLYSRSLHYVFNSVKQTELEWYQQGWFADLMLIVAIVVTVYTLGSDGGALLAAVASGSAAAISAAVYVLVLKIMVGVLISYALKLFVKAVGVEFAVLAAIVAAAYGSYGAFEAGSLAGAPWAQELLQVTNGLMKAVTETTKDALAGLADEFQQLQLLKDAAAIDVERANDLLENNNWLSPIVIFGESPNDFYNRTIHSGNPGIMSIGAISHYADIALTLPKLEDTLGDSL